MIPTFQLGQLGLARPRKRGDGVLLDSLIMAQSPFCYYKLDETSGVVCADSSGNARDLNNMVGTTTRGYAPLLEPGYSARFGPTGNSYAWDGSYHTAVSLAVAGNKEFTFESLIYLDSLSATSDIMHLGNNFNANTQGVLIRVDSSGRLKILAFVGSYQSPAVSANGAISAGALYHIAGRRKTGGVYDVFINGTNVGTGTNASNIRCNDTTTTRGTCITLGATQAAGSSANFWNGPLDYTTFYTSALTDAEILLHAQAAGLA